MFNFKKDLVISRDVARLKCSFYMYMDMLKTIHDLTKK